MKYPAGGARSGLGVLMVTGAYYPELSGGGLPAREIVRHLSDEGFFAVLTTTADRTLPAHDEREGIPVFRVFVDPARVLSKIIASWRMLQVLLRMRRRCGILHLHGFSQKSIYLIGLGRLLGYRVVMTLVSVGHDDPMSMSRQGRLAYWSYSKADVFCGVSPRFTELYAAAGLPHERFRMIPYGVDLQRFRPATPAERCALRRELRLPQDATVILFVAFFSREKCPDILFDAWARLAASGEPSSVLVFVGARRSSYYEVDERLAETMERAAAAFGLSSRVHFVDPTPHIEKYHRAADIFVLPSVREGLPGVLLEAMASGAACIATRLTGVTDALIDDETSGLLVPPRDVGALERGLTRLVSSPDTARAMGARARRRIERDYAVTTMAHRYLAVYEHLRAS